jgi:hypothetical protein
VPETAKYRQCAVRDGRYTLVSEKGAAQPVWELFDVLADPAQNRNIAAEHPAEVERLAAAYETWWTSVRPQFVNESATGPAVNPFKEQYWKQFGGGTSAEDLRLMDPARILELGEQMKPATKLPR